MNPNAVTPPSTPMNITIKDSLEPRLMMIGLMKLSTTLITRTP